MSQEGLALIFAFLRTLRSISDTNAYLLQCRSVSAKDISDFMLSGKYVAIALVDQHKLRYVVPLSV